ncbi:ABC transporter ATP-binding protein [Flavobacterium sp.]|uniref:ABC transporter ATP-binding protein n=1 Tax=Flavobacterium sp. TaxID=239 RepID=UPI003C44286C
MIEFKAIKKLHSATGTIELNLDFQIQRKEFITLYGSSGAGKTTTLQILSGLLQPDEGLIRVHDAIWLNGKAKINLKPQLRKIGYVFQDYALFPNMTVKENLSFALTKGQDKSIITELLDIMEIQQLQDLKPEKLSGGQKQRVALARALVGKPEILLLDEPLSAVDNEIRLKLQDYILKVHRLFNLTTILVSHDIAEIYKMSDRVLIIENGKINKQGTPDEVFSSRLMSGKFQFVGEILKIQKEEVVYLISVLVGNTIVKIVAIEEEIKQLNIGNKVLLASKAFNPIITKMD